MKETRWVIINVLFNSMPYGFCGRTRKELEEKNG